LERPGGQPCICSNDDIRLLLNGCVGLAPVAPPAPLLVFCKYRCSDCWKAWVAVVGLDAVFDCDCDGANTLELLTADAADAVIGVILDGG
jgi:hypothetical protein